MRKTTKAREDFRRINLRTERLRFSTLVIVRTVIGGMAGAPFLHFLLGRSGITLP